MSLNEICMELPSDHMTNVFGQFDHYMKIIERNLQVTVVCRNEQVKILGDANRISSAKQVISQLLELSRRGSTVTEQNVDYAIALVSEHETATLADIDESCVGYTVNGKPIRPKTLGQKKIYRADQRPYDRIWYRAGRYRKDLSCNGDGSVVF